MQVFRYSLLPNLNQVTLVNTTISQEAVVWGPSGPHPPPKLIIVLAPMLIMSTTIFLFFFSIYWALTTQDINLENITSFDLKATHNIVAACSSGHVMTEKGDSVNLDYDQIVASPGDLHLRWHNRDGAQHRDEGFELTAKNGLVLRARS
jgi:hypothetical protein